MGWPPSWRRAQARSRPSANAPSSAHATRPAVSRSRHPARAKRPAVASGRRRLRRRPTGLRRSLTQFLSPPSVQRSIRSSPSAGGGRRADEAHARCAGSCDSPGPGDQPRTPAAWTGLGWPLPRTHAAHSAGDSERAPLRLQNVRKHFRGVTGLDPRSSARWFEGWRIAVSPPSGAAPVVKARTWLARMGWRRHGLLDVSEAPRSLSRRR